MSKPHPNNQKANQSRNVKIRSYLFSVNLIKLLKRFPKNKLCNVISDQLLRSATSVGANIHEAKFSSSKRDFIKFYTIALKSANESKYWLSILRDTSDVLTDEIIVLLMECNEIAKMLAASLLTAKNKKS